MAALVLAIALAVAAAACGGDATVTSPTTTTETTGTPTTTATGSAMPLAEAARAVERQLAGIPQSGLVLGRRPAPVTIIEYASFDCPTCATVHADVVPALIDRWVRTGKASLEFRILVAGDHDLALALAVHAARPQQRGWQMIQLEYLRSTGAGSDPAAAVETPSSYARALGLDVPRWERDVDRPRWAADVRAALSVFKVARWGETPVFLVRRLGLDDQPFTVVSAPASADELDAAIDAVLAR